jgi:N-acetylmuramoyl-L-alanine amidase
VKNLCIFPFMKLFQILMPAFIVFMACNHNPYRASNKTYKKQVKAFAKELRRQPVQNINGAPFWTGTTNFNLRKPNLVIIHHTAQDNCSQTLQTFKVPRTQVSAHYVICKNGTVHHMLNDYLRAWHGGVARWGNISDVNSCSIGIELDNNGTEPFSETQLASLLVLLDTLKTRYNIPTANFIGHADVAPTRKVDPNITFPWKALAARGFGHWYDDTTNLRVPEHFNPLQALRVIGYDIRDSTAAILAFRRKYLQQEGDEALTDADKKILYTLCPKYQ